MHGRARRLRIAGQPLVEALGRDLLVVEQLLVAEAHRQGIVHRDLKPANILLAANGTPKVTDFGLAKSLTVDSGLTRTDSIMGSPSYMAPEQAEGKAKLVGSAADVYALGAILYELLTGRPPFRGATILETLEQAKAIEPVPPSRLVPGLTRDIETIALKCLQKDPARRYESATALAEDLRRFHAGEPIIARPVPFWERGIKWARRRPAIAALFMTVGSLAARPGALLAILYKPEYGVGAAALPILVAGECCLALLGVACAILNAAGLSFIGLGVRPPMAEWGIMVAEGAAFMVSGEWWIAFFPGAALMVAVFCFNLLGDGLRDIVDPQRRT